MEYTLCGTGSNFTHIPMQFVLKKNAEIIIDPTMACSIKEYQLKNPKLIKPKATV